MMITASALDYQEVDSYTVTHIAEEVDGVWTILDSTGARFWPDEDCTTEAEAVRACASCEGSWYA